MNVTIKIGIVASAGANAFAKQVLDAVPDGPTIADYRKRIVGAMLPVKFTLPNSNIKVRASITFDD